MTVIIDLPSFSAGSDGASSAAVRLPPLRSFLFASVLLVFLYLARAAAIQLLTGATAKVPVPEDDIHENDQQAQLQHHRREKLAFASFWRVVRNTNGKGFKPPSSWRQAPQDIMLTEKQPPRQPQVHPWLALSSLDEAARTPATAEAGSSTPPTATVVVGAPTTRAPTVGPPRRPPALPEVAYGP